MHDLGTAGTNYAERRSRPYVPFTGPRPSLPGRACCSGAGAPITSSRWPEDLASRHLECFVQARIGSATRR